MRGACPSFDRVCYSSSRRNMKRPNHAQECTSSVSYEKYQKEIVFFFANTEGRFCITTDNAALCEETQ